MSGYLTRPDQYGIVSPGTSRAPMPHVPWFHLLPEPADDPEPDPDPDAGLRQLREVYTDGAISLIAEWMRIGRGGG